MNANERFFRSFWPAVGPAITAHVTKTKREVSSLARLLQLRPGARILDVPCGFGRHAVELARRGFDVTGVDISAKLLGQARAAAAATGTSLDLRRADMRRLAWRGRFDAVLNLFTSFGYFGDRDDLRVLRNFQRALRPHGQLLMHLMNRDWLLRNFEKHRRTRIGGHTTAQIASFDFGSSILTTRWQARYGRRLLKGTTRLRHYSCHELVRMLNQAGFSDVKFFGDLSGGPLRLDSRWMVLRARR